MTDSDAGRPPLLDGRYQLESLLGRGGMAEVYRARDKRFSRWVAVKIMRLDGLGPDGFERFLREVSVTAAFAHPHILSLLESGSTIDQDGRRVLYYVMPLIEGETLRDRLARDGRLAVPDAIRLTRETLEALRYAHTHGVIHRDIKPANILLSDGHAIVADFGIARALPGHHLSTLDAEGTPTLTDSGFVVGTPQYMSPEQALADKTVNARCDLYAAGCLLYEMLVGTTPFEAPTAQAMLARKIHGVFVPPSAMRIGIPDALDDITRKALRPDPADRYESADAFLAALAPLSDTSAGSQRAPTARPKGPARRNRLVAMATGAVALVALAVLVTYFIDRQRNVAGSAGGTLQDDPARVVVLPFENLTGDSTLNHVASGLMTDLIDALMLVPTLTVISKNGVLRFRDAGIGLDSIARALQVGSIITGDVRRSGERIRVAVRLIDGRSGQQLAMHDTSGTSEELLEVRSAIIEDAARFLRRRVGEQVRLSTSRRQARSPEAWELVERARFLRDRWLAMPDRPSQSQWAHRFTLADSLAALAAQLDRQWSGPEVLRARLAIDRADMEENLAFDGRGSASGGTSDAPRYWNAAVAHAHAALARDPGDAEAHYLRGRARLELWRASRGTSPDTLRDLAEQDLRTAVEHDPTHAAAWTDLSFLQHLSGEFEDARRAGAEALRADAYLLNAAAVIARLQIASLGAGHVDEARSWCAEGRRRFPGDPQFFGCELTTMGWTASRPEDVGAAWRALQAAEQLDSANVLEAGWGTRRLLVAAIAARSGLRDSALAIVAAVRAGLPQSAATSGVDYGEAHVRALLGQREEALRLLQRFLGVHPRLSRQVAKSPWFAALRDDPRFTALTSAR